MAGKVVQLANYVTRRLDQMFPGYFPGTKHNHYSDFGFPTTLVFGQFYDMYCRNGLAKAAVNKTIAKTWQDAPCLLEKPRDDGEQIEETDLEKQVRERFAALRVWQRLAEADRRGLVGAYSGVILRFADSKAFDQPVDSVPGGLKGLVEIIPAWEGQLAVASYESNQTSEDYGQPTMFNFNESNVATDNKQPRAFQLHPDRVVIWSADGSVNGRSFLEPGYNDLMTMEKIIGAGGEGFWKNAKSAPVFEVDKEARITDMAKALGIEVKDLVEKMNAQVEDFQKGFDKMLMVQGMKANVLGVTLPQPGEFFDIALQSFCASIQCPTKVLVGMQTGERASSEDAVEWAQTNMSRRNDLVIPTMNAIAQRLVDVGILPEKEWTIDWTDLTETSMSEKIDRASKMADVNSKMVNTGEVIFTGDEIREAVGYEPLAEGDKYRDTAADETAAATPPGTPAGKPPAPGQPKLKQPPKKAAS